MKIRDRAFGLGAASNSTSHARSRFTFLFSRQRRASRAARLLATSSACALLIILMMMAILKPLPAFAQQPPPPIVSPDVQPDGKVTFRLLDPGAKEVKLLLEGAEPAPMTRDDAGIWSITVGPLAPDLYGYSFSSDGVTLLDPNNALIKPNLITPNNEVHVTGAPQLWEVADVPHGVVRHHFYKSKVVGDQRDFYVYTPPGFDPKSKTKYPVLYLLHGYSDDASGWTSVGAANVILDNLLAQGKVKPMIVVMPLGYGTPEMIKLKWKSWEHPDMRRKNFDRFRETLLNEVLPQVEKEYPVSTQRTDRAIAGLSMGGSESLLTGLNNIDKFAYVGSFSAGGLPGEFPEVLPSLDVRQAAQLRVLWVACGISDDLIVANRKFKAWLKSNDIAFTDIETPGEHTWMVWRRNLIAFTPLLFGAK